MEIRRGDHRDVPVLLDLFDEAVAWMVARGNTGQWGTEPWSAQPAKVSFVRELVDGGELWIAEVDGEPAGGLIVSDRPTRYVEPVDEPELYVVLLLVSRRRAGKKVGSKLLDFARKLAGSRQVHLMRVDCYAGGNGDLVRYYTGQGFTPTETIQVGQQVVQLFEQRV